jgi:hypothetical protein
VADGARRNVAGMTGGDQWSFAAKPGEPVAERWWRLFVELLAAGPISDRVRGERLRAFLNVVSSPVGWIQGKPVTDVSSWLSNCAMTMHAAQVWCGRQAMAAYVNGESIFSYVELRQNDVRWRKNDGTVRPLGPAIFYVGPSHTFRFDHVGAFGPESVQRPPGSGWYVTAEGGGGDGTTIQYGSRSLSDTDAYGRAIAGWWEIEDLLPDSAPAEIVGDPDTAVQA